MKIPKIIQLPSGNYFCRLRINGEEHCLTGENYELVETEAKAIKLGIKKPTQASKKITLTRAIDQYIESRTNALSPSTICGYKEIQRNRFQVAMNRDISSLQKEHWQRICNAEAKLCAAKTLKNAWYFISAVLFDQTGNRISVRLPAVVQKPRPYLDVEQIKVFVRAIRDDPCELPALLALCSLRRSEILGLRWTNIDTAKNLIRIEGAAVVGDDQKLVHKETNKNKSSRRVIPILVPRLAELIDQAPRVGTYVINTNPNTMWAQINKVCEEHDLPKVGVHGLRHSFASLAYHLNIPEKVAMEIGGWQNDQTMRKIYTHISQSDIETRAAEMANFFRSIDQNGNEMATPKSIAAAPIL